MINHTYTKTTTLPIKLDEVKLYGKITFDDDDFILSSLMIASAKHIENRTNADLFLTTHLYEVEDLENNKISIPVPKLIDINYVEIDGITAATSGYSINRKYNSFEIVLDNYTSSNVKVSFNSGYTQLPEDLRLAIIIKTLTLYDAQLSEAKPNNIDFSSIVEDLIRPYVIGF